MTDYETARQKVLDERSPTAKDLRALGLWWPPAKGWRTALLIEWNVPRDQWHPRRKPKEKRAKKPLLPVQTRGNLPWSTGRDVYKGGLHCIQLAVGYPPINVDEQAIEIKANQSGIDALEGNALEVPVEYDDQCADEGVPVYRVMA